MCERIRESLWIVSPAKCESNKWSRMRSDEMSMGWFLKDKQGICIEDQKKIFRGK